MKKKNVIQEVPCNNCVYIEEISRTLFGKRFGEHKNAVKKQYTNGL